MEYLSLHAIKCYILYRQTKKSIIMEFIKIVLKEDKGNRKINYALILFYY